MVCHTRDNITASVSVLELLNPAASVPLACRSTYLPSPGLVQKGYLSASLMHLGLLPVQAQASLELALERRPRGASFYHSKQKWRSQIMFGGKNHHLGYYDTQEQAMEVYEQVWLCWMISFS
jgi:hypothetical protein